MVVRSVILRTVGLGGVSGLWNQQLSKSIYDAYDSTTYHQVGNTQPPLGVTSSLCLSCHDGTVAVGDCRLRPGRQSRQLVAGDTFGKNLTSSHPFSLVMPIKDAVIWACVSSGQTGRSLAQGEADQWQH